MLQNTTADSPARGEESPGLGMTHTPYANRGVGNTRNGDFPTESQGVDSVLNRVSLDWIEFTLFDLPLAVPASTLQAPKTLLERLEADEANRAYLDALCDGLGGESRARVRKLVRAAAASRREEDLEGGKLAIPWTAEMIPELLGLHGREVLRCPKGNLGYLQQDILAGAIKIYSRGNVDMGVHVCISGEPVGKLFADPLKLLRRLAGFGAQFTRVDLAVDDFDKKLLLEKIIAAAKAGRIKTNFREWGVIESGLNSDGTITGRTFYEGSRESDVFFRFYDKLLERIKAGDDPGTLPKFWVRAEAELKGQAAQRVVYGDWKALSDGDLRKRFWFPVHHVDIPAAPFLPELTAAQIKRRIRSMKKPFQGLAEGADLGAAALGLIGNYLTVCAPSQKDKNKARWKAAQWWADFVGNAKLSLSRPIKAATMTSRAKWFCKQVAPSFAMLLHAQGADEMQAVYTNGKQRLKPQQWKEIEDHKKDQKTD